MLTLVVVVLHASLIVSLWVVVSKLLLAVSVGALVLVGTGHSLLIELALDCLVIVHVAALVASSREVSTASPNVLVVVHGTSSVVAIGVASSALVIVEVAPTARTICIVVVVSTTSATRPSDTVLVVASSVGVVKVIAWHVLLALIVIGVASKHAVVPAALVDGVALVMAPSWHSLHSMYFHVLRDWL